MDFLHSFYQQLFSHISHVDTALLQQVGKMLLEANASGGRVILVGNGGSAAIASHVAVDLTKTANITAINFNEPSLITCFANDYGYENWVAKALEFYAKPEDVFIAISSSGQSRNILNGAYYAKDSSIPVITFSGFSPNNKLRNIGDINFWVSSEIYNHVELTHEIWLLSLIDYLVMQQQLKNHKNPYICENEHSLLTESLKS